MREHDDVDLRISQPQRLQRPQEHVLFFHHPEPIPKPGWEKDPDPSFEEDPAPFLLNE